MLRGPLYARVSTNDQKTLPMQICALREYSTQRGWTVALQIREVGSGAVESERPRATHRSAPPCQIDVVLVWRLDRWGRSVTDLLATLQELEHLGVGFVSPTGSTGSHDARMGRAMAGLLAVFAEFEREILRERTCAGLIQARLNGKRLGRPLTAGLHAAEIRKPHQKPPLPKPEIARRLQISADLQCLAFWADLFPGEQASP